MNKYKKNFFLSLENSFNLFSISICNENYCLYDEFFELNIKSDKILKIINNILLKKRILLEEINFIIYGKGFANFTDLRILFSVIQSFSLGFKIPLLEISSMQAIALEAFNLYENNIIFIAYFVKKDFLCYQFYDKNNFFLKKKYNIKKISEIHFPKEQVLGIIKSNNENIKYLCKINSNLIVKQFIYPKSIYLDSLARKNIFCNKSNIVNIIPDYINNVLYKKYKI